ncbi:iron chelate uptake ABC transporter family permease subunit [Iocasia frigidifontis]|uniref:Iron chelate uptake ABC transporter family permease subunit n=1 Tax=Iocasia fonsfrigidae TaxID=2682810 RepID=A0A8A7KE07_9FIRM|nr:iron ABC transporter permease [Iocasia fonsfrigidae]QTL97127.1 iron chelate uptake ABC transporter family permease subunit [Iocasia fonsfrigidae]
MIAAIVKKIKENFKMERVIIKRLLIAVFFVVLLLLLSLLMGRYPISIRELFDVLFSRIIVVDRSWSVVVETVIFNIRLPRIIVAVLVGMALATSGTAYQGMFKNPMVSPSILGVSAGAGFGAAVAILLSLDIVGIQIFAFLFGILAVSLAFSISRLVSKDNNVSLILVLSGMIVSTLFSSLISLTKYVADPDDKLPAITFWLMGSFSSVGFKDVCTIIGPILLGLISLYLLSWKLNILSFGEEEAQSVGVNTNRLRMIVILSSTLITASAISVSGLIGWVGLIVPHLARMIVGSDHRVLIPTSMLMGGMYLLVVDDLARSIISIEIPIGILTSLIGAPFFVWLLLKSRRGWS